MTDVLSTFSQFLGAVEDGELHQEMTQQLRDVIAELHQHGGKPKAALTLSLEFQLDGGVIEVKADTKVKLPKGGRAKSIFWATPDNNLTRRNPRQAELPGIRDVTSDARMRSV